MFVLQLVRGQTLICLYYVSQCVDRIRHVQEQTIVGSHYITHDASHNHSLL